MGYPPHDCYVYTVPSNQPRVFQASSGFFYLHPWTVLTAPYTLFFSMFQHQHSQGWASTGIFNWVTHTGPSDLIQTRPGEQNPDVQWSRGRALSMELQASGQALCVPSL